jgi:hypothetical protein
VAFADRPPIRVKVRKAERRRQTFNNVPRYDLAAYELQKLLMDAQEYVVPPTSLRMLPMEQVKPYSPDVKATFPDSDDVLCVVQYWLQDVTAPADVLFPERFESDALYARHIGQLNVLTYLISHRDSNLGNFLISAVPEGARVFSIDHGVAFASEGSDRGELWRSMRVKRLPADTVGAPAQVHGSWISTRDSACSPNGSSTAVTTSRSLPARTCGRSPACGARTASCRWVWRVRDRAVWSRAQKLLRMIDDGDIATY